LLRKWEKGSVLRSVVAPLMTDYKSWRIIYVCDERDFENGTIHAEGELLRLSSITNYYN
jgi:hypothetical protein